MLKLIQKSLVRPWVFWPGIIILLITSISFYVLKEKEKRLRIDTQEQLTRTTEAKREVENKLEETAIAKKMVQKELNLEKERTLTLEKEVEEKKHQIELALEKLEKETIARREVETRLLIAMKEKGILEAKVRELTKETETVELEKIVVKTTPVLAGKVLAVDKEYSFVVVNLGRKNNLKLGDLLSIYRNEVFVGTVQVEKVEDRVCAAAILPPWQDKEFKEDDEVREI